MCVRVYSCPSPQTLRCHGRRSLRLVVHTGCTGFILSAQYLEATRWARTIRYLSLWHAYKAQNVHVALPIHLCNEPLQIQGHISKNNVSGIITTHPPIHPPARPPTHPPTHITRTPSLPGDRCECHARHASTQQHAATSATHRSLQQPFCKGSG